MKKKTLTPERRKELVDKAREATANWDHTTALLPGQTLVFDRELEPNEDADIAFEWYLHKCNGDNHKAFRILWDEAEHYKSQLNRQTSLVNNFLVTDRKRNAGAKSKFEFVVQQYLNQLDLRQEPVWKNFERFCGIKKFKGSEKYGSPISERTFYNILKKLQDPLKKL